MDEILNVLLWDLWHIGALGKSVGGAECINSSSMVAIGKSLPKRRLINHTIFMTECQCLIPPPRSAGERHRDIGENIWMLADHHHRIGVPRESDVSKNNLQIWEFTSNGIIEQRICPLHRRIGNDMVRRMCEDGESQFFRTAVHPSRPIAVWIIVLVYRAHLDALESQIVDASINLIQCVRIVWINRHKADDFFWMRLSVRGDGVIRCVHT